MRPFNSGESLQNLIRSAIPNFVEADYPQFVAFMATYVRFLEQQRTMVNETIFPEFGPSVTVQTTETVGGPLYETRKLLEYKDTATTIEDFRSHFLNMFGKNFPQYSYVPLDYLVRMFRQFYQSKGTVESIQWFFRVFFNEHAEVYFPRTDILKPSDGTWVAPINIKVSTPIDGHPNADVATFYTGQRVQTDTGSAQVEAVISYIVGQAFNQNILVNELTLKFNSILGTFSPGQTIINIESDTQVQTTILPVITDLIVNTGGSNYAVGDVVTISEGPTGGYGYGAYGIVQQVSNTAINGITVLDGGTGYITGLPCTFISTTGRNAAATVQDIAYGGFQLEDGTGYLSLEQQTPDETNVLQLEDVNVLFLELIIDPFCNASVSIVLTNPDYGIASGVAQLNGVTFDSAIEIALAAGDTKPFMHPWVFTNALETTATLANAAMGLAFTSNTFISNTASVFALTSPQDLLSNLSSTVFHANVIVSQVAQGGATGTVYLSNVAGLSFVTPGTILKATGTGTVQAGTVTHDGTANVVGTGTLFSSLTPNTHVRFADGTTAVVRSVVNNTFLTVFTATGTPLTANAYSVIPTARVTDVTAQAQRYYGKIKTVQLLQNGTGYQTPPAVTADSVSARAQELFYLDPGVDTLPGTGDDSIVASANRIRVFDSASLRVQQDSGQVQRVKILNSGVNYQDANTVVAIATHGVGRTGSQALFSAVTGAQSQQQGEFTTSQGFLSADKFLQDSTFYNDYTYVVRAAEPYTLYRDLLQALIHPAGFKAIGEFVLELANAVVLTTGTLNVRRPGLLPLDLVIAPYISTTVSGFPADYGGDI